MLLSRTTGSRNEDEATIRTWSRVFPIRIHVRSSEAGDYDPYFRSSEKNSLTNDIEELVAYENVAGFSILGPLACTASLTQQ